MQGTTNILTCMQAMSMVIVCYGTIQLRTIMTNYIRAPRLAGRPAWPEPTFFVKFGKDVINYYLSLE
jgi:hypothetical protein